VLEAVAVLLLLVEELTEAVAVAVAEAEEDVTLVLATHFLVPASQTPVRHCCAFLQVVPILTLRAHLPLLQ